METTIAGVALKELVTHPDERGFFRELIRVTDPFFDRGFGQWSHSWMHTGVLKAWHLHHRQADYWYVCGGLLRVGLGDLRPGSPTRGATMDFLMGDGQPPLILKIPPDVAHGCKVLRGPANLLYVTSNVYNPDDELRLPPDTRDIAFDWQVDPAVP
jgi:dTDP-4-dehydrorhamnose 3,5-epimerase